MLPAAHSFRYFVLQAIMNRLHVGLSWDPARRAQQLPALRMSTATSATVYEELSRDPICKAAWLLLILT